MKIWVKESDLRCMADAQTQQFGSYMVTVQLLEPDDDSGWRAIRVHVGKDKG